MAEHHEHTDAALEAQLRAWADATAPLSPPVQSGASILRQANDRRARRFRRRSIGVAAACMVALAGALWAQQSNDSSQLDVAAQPPETTDEHPTTTAAPDDNARTTLTLPIDGITVGDDLIATVTFRNDTGVPIEAPNCGGVLTITLSSEQAAQVASDDVCSDIMPLVLPVGESSYEIAIDTTYSQCTTGPVTNERTTPACDFSFPPALPAGLYSMAATSSFGPSWVPSELPQLVIHPATNPASGATNSTAPEPNAPFHNAP